MVEDSKLEFEDEPDDDQRTQQPQNHQNTNNSLPFKQGAVIGAIAVIVTYLSHLLVTVIATAQASPVGSGEDVTELVASWEAAGWSYLSVFGAGFEAEGERAVLADVPNQAAAFVSSPFLLSSSLLFVVAIGGAVGAGYAIARYTEAEDATEAVKASVTVVPPYLVFALIAAVVMTHTFTEDAAIVAFFGDIGANAAPGLEEGEYIDGDGVSDIEFGPATSSAVLYAGLLVPAVLAVIGGLITQWRDALKTVMSKVDQQ